jgi:hypothetical protein
MSALPGDSAPFVFPPFVPPVARTAPPRPEAAPAAEELAIEVPLPAHDIGDPDTDLPRPGFDGAEAGYQPWEEPAPPAADDLPWLEMPVDGPRVHSTDAPAEAAPAGYETAPAEGETEPAADFAYDYTPPVDAPAASQPTSDFGYDFAPAAAESAPMADSAFDFSSAAEDGASVQTAAEFAYDSAPAVEESAAAEFAYDDSPAPPFDAPGEAAEPMPWLEEPAPAAALAWDVPVSHEADATPAVDALAAELGSPEPVSDFVAPEPPEHIDVAPLAAIDAAPLAGYEAPAFEPAPAYTNRSEYGEVADRLETIARSLRDDPAAFLAGGSGDALGLLVTGFVLGYGHGRREIGS